MLSNSWIIVKKDTQEAVIETWSQSALEYLKPEFEAIPTHEYLYNLNQKIKTRLKEECE
jgi:hypothetical protein